MNASLGRSIACSNHWIVMERLQDLFIGIAGMIGAGKSTLATRLGELLDLPVYYEPVKDNDYLADFYRDTAKYAFATQIYLLNRRFQQHQEIIWRGGGGVQDRTIYEDAVFAKMLVKLNLMEERDYNTYVSLFRHMSNFMCRPSVIVYLDVSPERSMDRIRMRSRDVESGISLEYLQALYAEYELFIADISRTVPVIRIDYDRFHSAEEMAEVIEREYLHSNFVREVTWTPTTG
ncbi:MAG: deoxynucleoside kinase [Deltaproteobacteria bacterium]|nr:deoxynucleoside kinase [Deltaproteobacteria bacterium]HCH65199.1 deoxynucleoside kinase [Deltaproteobacteria bacterium]